MQDVRGIGETQLRERAHVPWSSVDGACSLTPDERLRHYEEEFSKRGWESQFRLFDDPENPMAKIDFIKSRVGVEVAFSHASFLGIDLLKFQLLSYADLDKNDVGIYIVPANELPRRGFEGSVTFDKVKRYLPHLRSAIQVPVWVVGLTP